MCSSVDYWRCRWIKLGGALEYPQRGPSGPHPGPDLSTACPQGYPQGWKGGTRRCGSAHTPPAHRYPPPRARPRPDPCHAPPAHRRSGRRRAGTTGRPASQPSCGRSWRPALPLRPGLTGSAPTTPARPGARPRAVLPGRSRWRGRSEAGGSCKDDAPSPPHPDARSDRGTRRRTASERHRGPGSGRGGGGSLPAQCMWACPRTSLRARSSLRVLRRGRGWAIVTMRRARAVEHAPPRARMGRWRAVRRLKKVAGACLSPLALRHFRPEVAQ